MIILGYALTIIYYAGICFSRFIKEKRWIMTVSVICELIMTCGLFCFNSMTGVFNSVIVLLSTASVTLREHIFKSRMIWLYAIFQAIMCESLYSTYVGLSSILTFLSSSAYLISIWFLPPQMMRIVGSISSFTFMLYQLSIKNYAGLLELFVVISSVSSYVKYRKEIV